VKRKSYTRRWHPRVWPVLALFALIGSTDPNRCVAVILDGIENNLTYFSPNGDGIQDDVTFTYSLSESATVSLTVVEKDSSTVVKTLLVGILQEPDIDYDVVWDGMTSGGVQAPEDTFLVFARATSATGTGVDTLFSRYFFLDVTPPNVVITDISPEIFAPGSSDPPIVDTLFVEYDIHDPPPSEEVAVQVVIFDQTPTEITTLRNGFVPSNGSYDDAWDGSGATTDGDHTARVFVKDEAGNEADASRTFDVSIGGPKITVTNVENGAILPVLPDSLHGWTWHRYGVQDSVWVRFSTPTNVSELFVRVITTHFHSDTLFFSSPLADVVEEQEVKYTFSFKTKNLLAQGRIANTDVTWDQTPPPPPILEQPPSVTHSRNFVLNGHIDASVGFDDVMRIYRNDAFVDSAFPAVPGQWPHAMTLVDGLNRIHAIMVDKAGNVGAPSNTIEVTWDQSDGFFIRQPFRPNDTFQITSAEPLSAGSIRIYDLSGNLVQVIRFNKPGTSLSIPWDGLNGDGTDVKKGPLVAVVQLTRESGTTETQRKIFLFEP
jgi:hypothetical protein